MTGARWQLMSASVAGPRKQRNQDCGEHREVLSVPESVVALAVADGHGSAAHHLSHLGARLAVDSFFQTTAEAVRIEAERTGPWPDASAGRPAIGRDVVRTWRRKVAEQARDLAGGDPETGPGEGGVDYVPFGSTLIGAVLGDHRMAAWQVGDGEFVVVDSSGRITQPIRPMTGVLGDETESLCSPDAESLVRSHISPAESSQTAPVLVLACTDGLSNSFPSNAAFLEFVRGLHGRLDRDGAAGVEPRIHGWLATASGFSGDDATAVVAWREAGAA